MAENISRTLANLEMPQALFTFSFVHYTFVLFINSHPIKECGLTGVDSVGMDWPNIWGCVYHVPLQSHMPKSSSLIF